MAKDMRRKTRGSWWYGWVKYTYTGLDGTIQEAVRTTDYEFATAAQAQQAADALANSMAALAPVQKWQRRHRSKNDSRNKSRFTVLKTGADRSLSK